MLKPITSRSRVVCWPFVVCCLWCGAVASGQQPPRTPIPFFQPDRFFSDMFGVENEQERKALQNVEIPFRDESREGNAAANKFIVQLKSRGIEVEDRGKDVEYLRCLVKSLRPLMKNSKRYRKIRVLVADSQDTDAISFPGGTLVVFRGLIDFCESEAAIVGILGHELSHIDRGHQLYYLRRFQLMQQSFQARDFDPRKMMSMGSMMAKTFMRPFRPEEETEADLDGANWCFRLGYDADEMAHVFLRLHQRDVQQAGGLARAQANPMSSFFRSHPFHMDRYKAILMLSKKLKESKPNHQKLYVGRENIQNRICRNRRQFAESAE